MLNSIINHIVKSTHTTVRIYGDDGYLIQYFGDNRSFDPVLIDSALKKELISQVKVDYPCIYEEEHPIYYSIIHHKSHYYIIGPISVDFRLQTMHHQPIGEYYAQKHNIPNEKKRISFCDFEHFCEETLLLFNILNNQNMSVTELVSMNFEDEEMLRGVEKELGQVYFRYQENEKVHNSYDHEVRELNSIREGDVEKLKQVMNEVVEGEYAVLSRDSLQAAKNLAIVVLAIVARSAIDGGMNAEDSFSLNDSYILKVDGAQSVGQIWALVRKAKIQYAEIVNERKQSLKNNQLIEQAKRIIYKNMHSKIIISDIAKELNISQEYLSTLFKREEKITVNDYVMKVKIRLAENLLAYTNHSIKEVAYYFGFCSQSHFGLIFKKWSGMTPKHYRDKFGNKDFIKK